MDSLLALERTEAGGAIRLCAPSVGLFRASVDLGESIEGGMCLGSLQILSRRYSVLAPRGVQGRIVGPKTAATRSVGYGEPLFELGTPIHDAISGAATSPGAMQEAPGEATCAVCTPIDGIFYLRASPDSEPFVNVGDPVARGQTLGLVEVMKTFNPIRLDAPDAPDAGVVESIEVGDQQEVCSGQVLLRIRPS